MSEPTNLDSAADVTIVGRLGSRVDERVLPSGDRLVTFTIVVDRPHRRGAPPTAARVDAVPCQAFGSQVTRVLSRLESGEWVQAQGVLRRRFWRSGAGLGSALEVEVSRLRRAA